MNLGKTEYILILRHAFSNSIWLRSQFVCARDFIHVEMELIFLAVNVLIYFDFIWSQ
jgi:hypothetical protein